MSHLKQTPQCLLVDQDHENLEFLSSILSALEIKVFTATTGSEALKHLEAHQFAVAFIEVLLPDINGFELAEVIRSRDESRSLPIILMTSTPGVQKVFKGFDSGAVDFLQKPLSSQVVLGKVKFFTEIFSQKADLEEKITELEETKSGLQQALRSRDEFMSICSHELKTPLTSLKMQLQILERMRTKLGDDAALAPERMTRFLTQADRGIERIIFLVNDMLDISRVATGRLSLNLEFVKICELTKEIVEKLTPMMELNNCKASFTSCGNYSAKVDTYRYEQVLTNILTNASQYAPDRPVDVSVACQNGYVEISVRDHGDGISEADQERIFQRFEKAPSHHKVGGLGLGLFISKEIIELHQGSITVESKLKEGSSFKISLPQVSEVLG